MHSFEYFSNFVFRIFDCFKNRVVLKKFVAFTLAETLIVMGIIGVVAALTIPNVNKNTGRAETVTKVKKIYAELSEAHDRATAVYGPLKTWFTNDTNGEQRSIRYFNRLTEFLKVQKLCDEMDECIRDDINGLFDNFNSETMSLGIYPTCTAQLNNGISIGLTSIYLSPPNYGVLYVDIDGQKGKNKAGVDVFSFDITNDGIVPVGRRFLDDDSLICDCFYYGYCTEWVIRNGNMDYLDTNHDSEDNAGKCKNGKQLSTTVSSCK